MNEHKEEIRSTRVGCLGSSDGKLLLRVASEGFVPKGEYKRLAVCKGLIEQTEIPRTAAIEAGDYIENCIYEYIKQNDERWESNPLVVSKKYSTDDLKLISHPDMRHVDYENKVITYVEVKTSKFTTIQVKQTYKAQLFIHSTLGHEEAMELGRDWKFVLLLAHYNTDGLDLENTPLEFDPQRLNVSRVVPSRSFFNIGKVMSIIREFLNDFNEYYEGDEIDADLLAPNVRSQFDEVTLFLKEIKEREQKVEDFKARLYSFMKEKDIKSVKCDAFSIVRIDETTSKSFDGKKYIEDLKEEHPRVANRIIAKYTKETKKKGYAMIKVNKNKDIEDIFNK